MKHSKKALGLTPRKPVFPAHLDANTPEEWRGIKRKEWREVMQAIHRYERGAAYAPGGSALYQLGKLAGQVAEAVEADDWVCW